MRFLLEILTIFIVALIAGFGLGYIIHDEFWHLLITLLLALTAGRLVNPTAYKIPKKDN